MLLFCRRAAQKLQVAFRDHICTSTMWKHNSAGAKLEVLLGFQSFLFISPLSVAQANVCYNVQRKKNKRKLTSPTNCLREGSIPLILYLLKDFYGVLSFFNLVLLFQFVFVWMVRRSDTQSFWVPQPIFNIDGYVLLM